MRGPWAATHASGHLIQAVTLTGIGTLRLVLFGSIMATLVGCASTPMAPRDARAEDANVAPSHDELIRQDVSATLTAAQPVVVDNPYGDVRLRFGGYKDELEIHAVAQKPDKASSIVLQPGSIDGTYRIAPRLPPDTLIVEGQRLDLVVFVPLGHSVNVRTERGVIESRGIRAAIDLRSTSGNIAIRGTQGEVHAETGPGTIEASLLHAAPGSHQRIATSTGSIVLAVSDDLDARVQMSTSALFATEYSVQIERMTGQEPNKRAIALIGEQKSELLVESRRGEIRLQRWTGFTTADGRPVEEDEDADTDSD